MIIAAIVQTQRATAAGNDRRIGGASAAAAPREGVKVGTERGRAAAGRGEHRCVVVLDVGWMETIRRSEKQTMSSCGCEDNEKEWKNVGVEMLCVRQYSLDTG